MGRKLYADQWTKSVHQTKNSSIINSNYNNNNNDDDDRKETTKQKWKGM